MTFNETWCRPRFIRRPSGGKTTRPSRPPAALIAYSGVKTGRSPKDKRIVRHADSEHDVWWGSINVPIDDPTFRINLERAKDYLNTCDRLYVVDAFAGWDPDYRIKVRIICSRPYHALFMDTMLVRPTREQLADFGEPDAVIYNAGRFPANRYTSGMTSKTSIDLNLESGELVILGTEYAGEMKKGVFTMMNYFMPKQGVLSMHCSITADRQTGRTSVLFGLSGTGKTTLSADPKRHLVGDDEHCWTDRGMFNIEGGCYAKAIDLRPSRSPRSSRRCDSARCWKTSSMTSATTGWTSTMTRSRKTRAGRTLSSSSTTPGFPAWPNIRPT